MSAEEFESSERRKSWGLDEWTEALANPAHFTVEIDEGQRQLILMALSHLAVEKPGFDHALSEIASKIDNKTENGPQMYTEFKKLHAPTHLMTLQLDAIGAVLIQQPNENTPSVPAPASGL